MAKSVVAVAVSQATIKKHVAEVRKTWAAAQKSLWDYLLALETAWIELQETLTMKEFADELNVSESQISKHLKIARNQLIYQNRNTLPGTETALYTLALIYDDCAKLNHADPDKRFSRIIEHSDASKGVDFFEHERNKIRLEVKRRKQKLKGQKVLTWNGERSAGSSTQRQIPWSEFKSSKLTYSRFFINATEDLLEVAAQSPDEIMEIFPLAKKRSPSQLKQSHCFVFTPVARIGDAVSILEACGFKLKDIFGIAPEKNLLGLIGANVLLHGTYGANPKKQVIAAVCPPTLQGAIELAESFGDDAGVVFYAGEVSSKWDFCSPSYEDLESI